MRLGPRETVDQASSILSVILNHSTGEHLRDRAYSASGFPCCASQRRHKAPANAAANCAAINGRTSEGRMPAKVSLAALASVTAGFANDVEAVNQYAAAM